jgi:two-component system chemotaxis response regulator CheY
MARIMIADDSDAIRLVLGDILSIDNHEITAQAINGEDAIEKFFQTNPDVLLLDLAMPKKDGLQVVKEIMAKKPSAKIILITASDNQAVIKQCMDAGATAYISKPFDFDHVLKLISSIVK